MAIGYDYLESVLGVIGITKYTRFVDLVGFPTGKIHDDEVITISGTLEYKTGVVWHPHTSAPVYLTKDGIAWGAPVTTDITLGTFTLVSPAPVEADDGKEIKVTYDGI